MVLLDKILENFHWWEDLHGLWRDNPAYNTAFSTAHPGQDFAADMQLHFSGMQTTAEVGHGGEEEVGVDEVDEVDAGGFEEAPAVDEVMDGADDSVNPHTTSSDIFQPTPTDSGVGLFSTMSSTHLATKHSFPRGPQTSSSVPDSVRLHRTF